MKKVSLRFEQAFRGELKAPKASVKVGVEENELAPYDMLLGALASCLYSTFLDITVKKRITLDHVDIEVEGEKREEIPTTLKWVNVKFIVHGADKTKGLDQALQLATEYCSIYQTISHVAEMHYALEIVE